MGAVGLLWGCYGVAMLAAGLLWGSEVTVGLWGSCGAVEALWSCYEGMRT